MMPPHLKKESNMTLPLFLYMYRLIKSENMNTKYTVKLLAIANNHILSLAYRHEGQGLKREKKISWKLIREIQL
jgi:hypothetical protein